MFRISPEPDPQARFSEDDFVARLESHAARAARHRDVRPSRTTPVPCSLPSSVHAVPAAVGSYADVGVAARDSLLSGPVVRGRPRGWFGSADGGCPGPRHIGRRRCASPPSVSSRSAAPFSTVNSIRGAVAAARVRAPAALPGDPQELDWNSGAPVLRGLRAQVTARLDVHWQAAEPEAAAMTRRAATAVGEHRFDRARASRDGARIVSAIALNGKTRRPRPPGWISSSALRRPRERSRAAREYRAAPAFAPSVERAGDFRFEPLALPRMSMFVIHVLAALAQAAGAPSGPPRPRR